MRILCDFNCLQPKKLFVKCHFTKMFTCNVCIIFNAAVVQCNRLGPHIQLVYIGNPFSLNCATSGSPLWFLNGQQISNRLRSFRMMSAEQKHGGIYECMGISHKGIPFNATAEVVVGSK